MDCQENSCQQCATNFSHLEEVVYEEGECAEVVPGEAPRQLAQLPHDGSLERVLHLRGRAGLFGGLVVGAGPLAAVGRFCRLGGLRGGGVGVPLGNLEEVLEKKMTM